MYARFTVRKIFWGGADQYVVAALFDQQKPGDRFASTSDPLSKEEAEDALRKHGLEESDIKRLVAYADSSE